MRHLLLALLTVALLPSFLRGQTRSPESTFWDWFAQNERSLYSFEADQEPVFDRLAAALQRVHPSLTFEFGPVEGDGRREFVISADGLREAFSAVERLHAAAPVMPRWQWVKFRPRREPMDLEIGGRSIRAGDVRYLLFSDEDRDKVGILLFMPGYTEAEHNVFGQAGFLLLDNVLGEYDIETRVGAIDFQSPDSQHFARSKPLSELAEHFDQYFRGAESNAPD